MSSDWDFGQYGKGIEGYVHYNTAVDRTQKNSGGGGGKRPNNNGGCLSCLLMMVLPLAGVVVTALLR